jgi:hypothetical protein
MSVWNRDSHVHDSFRGASRSPLQWRFTLEVMYQSWSRFWYSLNGGVWADKGVVTEKWKGHVLVYMKYKNGRQSVVLTKNFSLGFPSSPQLGGLGGDSADFTHDHRTWLPMISFDFFLDHKVIRDLLTGQAELEVQPVALDWYYRRSFIGPDISVLTRHRLTIFEPSDNVLVIKSAYDIPQTLISDLKIGGGVWIYWTWVSKTEFDLFWKNLFSRYGNDTPQAHRASIQWGINQTFVQEKWQIALCFALLANVSP